MKLTIGVFCDTFSPQTDEAALAASASAGHIQEELGRCFVVAPKIPGHKDRAPYDILRTRSLPLPGKRDRRLPLPWFERGLMRGLSERNPDLLHVHSPFAVMRMAGWLREVTQTPLVLSIHERYSELLSALFPWKPAQDRARKYVLRSLNAADEVWVDSRALAADIRELGYSGGFVRMEHGCELDDGRVTAEWRGVVEKLHTLTADTVLLLCVGRLDRESKFLLRVMGHLRDADLNFKLVVLGDGPAKDQWVDRVTEYKLGPYVQLAARPDDPELLRAYYARASLLLCPWEDTLSSLCEASALGTAAMLLRDSGLIDGLEPGKNAFVGSPDPALFSEELRGLLDNRTRLRAAGKAAHDAFYIPGRVAAGAAWRRYEMVCRLHREHQEERQRDRELIAR